MMEVAPPRWIAPWMREGRDPETPVERWNSVSAIEGAPTIHSRDPGPVRRRVALSCAARRPSVCSWASFADAAWSGAASAGSAGRGADGVSGVLISEEPLLLVVLLGAGVEGDVPLAE